MEDSEYKNVYMVNVDIYRFLTEAEIVTVLVYTGN